MSNHSHGPTHTHSHDDHEHTHGPGCDHDHSHDSHDVSKHVRVYLIIFGALIFGTLLTVLASYVNLGSPARNIALALVIASAKVFLVAGYFMHLLSEKTTIYAVLITTAVFFVGLMALTLWAMVDFPDGSRVQY